MAGPRGDTEQGRGWGPEGAAAALSLTFDNLGEAAELELGLWPERKSQGRHPSVRRGLPGVLAALRERELPATFFVEGVNAEAYPAALREIGAEGHELALHAWRHEQWDELAPEREAELLDRGTLALEALGSRPLGFRPPGGRLTRRSEALLAERGYRYVSPAGSHTEPGRLVHLPFRWELVDAYHHYPGSLRARLVGDAPGEESKLSAALPPRARSLAYNGMVRLGTIRGAGRMEAAMLEQLFALPGHGGHLTLLFHPFLLVWRRTLAVLDRVLAEVARLRERNSLWVAPMAQVAAEVAR